MFAQFHQCMCVLHTGFTLSITFMRLGHFIQVLSMSMHVVVSPFLRERPVANLGATYRVHRTVCC